MHGFCAVPLPWKEWCHWPQLNGHWPACCSMTWHDFTCAGSNSFCLFLSLFVFFCLFLALSVFFCLFLSFLVFFCNFVKANHIGPYPIDSNPVLWVLIFFCMFNNVHALQVRPPVKLWTSRSFWDGRPGCWATAPEPGSSTSPLCHLGWAKILMLFFDVCSQWEFHQLEHVDLSSSIYYIGI